VTVHLVGAGPGDPGLITARGLELVRGCDVLIHDALVSPDLVAEAPDDALVIPRAPLRQEAINDLLVAYGRAGLDVVRLKGGDPFVFGRGGEEALALAEAGVEFTVTPGVSSIAAVPAAAMIPVTHRGVSDRVTIATPAGADAVDYERLAAAGGTLVFFMGLERLAALVGGLLGAGLDPSTPAAVISNGTLPEQERVIATLDELVEAAGGLPTPALVIVGDVVAVGSRISEAVSRTCDTVLQGDSRAA
jgi:uroporphyrin-III C-methyltransferase